MLFGLILSLMCVYSGRCVCILDVTNSVKGCDKTTLGVSAYACGGLVVLWEMTQMRAGIRCSSSLSGTSVQLIPKFVAQLERRSKLVRFFADKVQNRTAFCPRVW